MVQDCKVLLVFAVLAIGATSLVSSKSNGELPSHLSIVKRDVAPGSARSRFLLPRVFDFERFQKFFNKHYSSFAEKAVRAKLYLGRAFRAFISTVSYKHHRSSSYLSINQMSDWTPAEFKKTLLRPEFVNLNRVPAPLNPTQKSNQGLAPVASLGAIEDVLEEVVEHRYSKPAFAEVAEALERNTANLGIDIGNNVNDLSATDQLSVIVLNAEPSTENKEQLDQAEEFLTSVVESFSKPTAIDAKPIDEVHIDHRQCLPPVQDQLKCAACYAFVTLALYEWAYCKAKNKVVSFSKQHVVDCGDPNRRMNGCGGGNTVMTREFMLTHGLVYESDYPYEARQAQCRYPLTDSLDTVKIYDQGWELMSLATVEEKLKRGPLVVTVDIDDINSQLQEYGGGVDTNANKRPVDPSYHGMLMVGSGIEDGVEYFLFRNSWGTHWGEKGHVKFSKQHNHILDDSGMVLVFADIPVVEEIPAKMSPSVD